MSRESLLKSLYEVLYNNLLLPRTREIDRDAERDAFDGTTESLVQLHKESQIPFEQFANLSETEIKKIVEKTRNLPISKERFFELTK